MFKKFFSIVAITLFMIACQSNTDTAFKVDPAKPEQGSKVKIIYNSAKTQLKGSKKITVTAYQFNQEVQDARDVPMKKEGAVWTAELPVAKDVCGIIMMFSNGDKKDNFNNKGYVAQVYDKDGNKVKGLDAGLATAYLGWINNLNIDPDRAKAYEMFKKAFAEDPSIKRAYITKYLPTLMREEKNNPQQKLGKELKQMEKYPNLTEDELAMLVDMYGALNDAQNFTKYRNESLAKFPKGKVAQKMEYQKMLANPSAENILKFKEQFPKSQYVEGLTYNALRNFINKKDFKGAAKFCEQLKDEIHPYYFSYIVGKMLEANGNMKTALKVAKLGVKKAEAEASKPDSTKPKDMTLSDWHEMNDYYLGRNYSAYAQVLNRLGKKSEALKAAQRTIKLIKQDYVNPKTVKLYANLLIDQKEYAKAKDYLSKMVKEGMADSKMKDLLKKAYSELNKSDKGFNAYLLSLESKANEKMTAALKDEMINEPAPAFKLKDLNGKEVSLSDFKGKIVAVDFWATWCNPCLNSFPGMKKVVEEFKNDKDVAFLFVDTWERVANKLANAKNFIAINKYPFHVLLDSSNTVVSSFKVSGIPTKFVIGRKGNIRFKSVGFDGSTEKLISKISTMINMLK